MFADLHINPLVQVSGQFKGVITLQPYQVCIVIRGNVKIPTILLDDLESYCSLATMSCAGTPYCRNLSSLFVHRPTARSIDPHTTAHTLQVCQAHHATSIVLTLHERTELITLELNENAIPGFKSLI